MLRFRLKLSMNGCLATPIQPPTQLFSFRNGSLKRKRNKKPPNVLLTRSGAARPNRIIQSMKNTDQVPNQSQRSKYAGDPQNLSTADAIHDWINIGIELRFDKLHPTHLLGELCSIVA